MFEIGTTDHLWEVAKKYPVLSNHPNTLKPLGYAHIVTLIETFKPKRVLEVGHGGGSFIFQIFRENKEIEFWGLDDEVKDSAVSAEDLKNTKEWNPHVKFVSGLLGANLKELPENYFDLVFSVSVIEHIPHENLDDVFKDTYRILKPGGIVAHSYDVFYSQDTKPVFEAFEKNNFKWLKGRDTMTVVWEKWLNKYNEQTLEKLIYNAVFENPLVVAENYMWMQKREHRPAPMNFMTILMAARKPDQNVPKDKNHNYLSSLFKSLKFNKSSDSGNFISLDNIDDFTYSKKTHLDLFKKNNYDKELYKNNVDFDYSELNVYQDLLIFSFIRQNLVKGSKILDVGGGASRILKYFKNEHECWNIDLLNKSGKQEDGIMYVNDHLGKFSRELPEDYFDLVFSISAFIHGHEEDAEFYNDILSDNNRILNSSGIAFHCFPLSFKEPVIISSFFVNHFLENQKTLNEKINFFGITIDPDLYFTSEKYYEDNWQKAVGKTYEDYGKPFSFQLVWMKSKVSL